MCRFFMLFYLAIYFSSFRSAAYIVFFFLIHFAPSVALILFPYRFDWKCGE